MTDFSELAHLDATAQAELVRKKMKKPIDVRAPRIGRTSPGPPPEMEGLY